MIGAEITGEPAPARAGALSIDRGRIWALAAYLFTTASVAAWILVGIFPQPDTAPPGRLVFSPLAFGGFALLPALRTDQGLLLLALCAGVLGSFLHAAQSLAAYVGNRELRASWVLWYVLRPFVGGVLGLMFYFVVRAGLISTSADSVSPYGVVSFGALAGWFSKQATDKLAEVFETVFGTSKDRQYRDKLGTMGVRPRIARLEPASLDPAAIPPAGTEVAVIGEGLGPSTVISIDGNRVPATVSRDGSLRTAVVPAMIRTGATALSFAATNPPGPAAPAGSTPLVSESAALPLVVPAGR